MTPAATRKAKLQPGAPMTLAEWDQLPVSDDVLFEVVSDSTKHEDVGPKFHADEHAGIPHYWILDLDNPNPAERFHAYQLKDGHYESVPALDSDAASVVNGPHRVDVELADPATGTSTAISFHLDQLLR